MNCKRCRKWFGMIPDHDWERLPESTDQIEYYKCSNCGQTWKVFHTWAGSMATRIDK